MIRKIISEYEKNIYALKYIYRLISMGSILLEAEVYCLYLDLGGTINVANHLNENGHRLKSPTGQRKYTPADISKVLEQENPEGVSEELDKLVKHMFYKRSRYKKWHERLVEAYYLHIENE